jgi:hypothetical protein
MSRRKVIHNLFNCGLLRQIIVYIREMTPYHRTCHGEIDRVAASNAHDLDIFTPGQVVILTVRGAYAYFSSKDQTFQGTQRSVPDAERRVIGEQNASFMATRKQRLQVMRTRMDQFVDLHVKLCVQRVQVAAQPRAGTLDRNLLD